MARWCVLLLLLAVLGTQADDTTTETAPTEEKAETHPTRMTPPQVNITVPPLVHQEVNTTTAPNATEKTQGKGAAASMGGQLAIVAVLGAWLTLSAI